MNFYYLNKKKYKNLKKIECKYATKFLEINSLVNQKFIFPNE